MPHDMSTLGAAFVHFERVSFGKILNVPETQFSRAAVGLHELHRRVEVNGVNARAVAWHITTYAQLQTFPIIISTE
mgnify:CR=1 FL=1